MIQKPLLIRLVLFLLLFSLILYYISETNIVYTNFFEIRNQVGIVNTTSSSQYLKDEKNTIQIKNTETRIQIKNTEKKIQIGNTEKNTRQIKNTDGNTKNNTKKEDAFGCYKNNSLNELPDILQAKPGNKSIILFHETSCKSRTAGRLVLTPRQACSIESAALQNPEYDVYVLIMAPTKITNTGDVNDRIISTLMQYNNIHFFHVDINTYFENTLVEELYHSGQIEESPYRMIHLADVIRFVSMWRFGGIYMDLDVIVLKNLDGLQPSFSAMESQEDMAAGVIRFSNDRKGRKWVEMCLKDLNRDYRKFEWSYNANGVLSRLAQNICGTKNTTFWKKENCDGFEIYEPNEFYPIYFREWQKYFEKQYVNETMNAISKSTAIHFWNNLSKNYHIKIGTNTSAMELIAQKYCPRTYSQLYTLF